MPLVNAKCTNCGGTLTVDASKEAAICDFCGSPYIVEKAIQNYNYYVTQNIKADNVNVTAKGEAEKERLLHNAETNMGFKDYNKAYEIYKQVSEDYPDDYRGWYGMASILTSDFKKTIRNDSKRNELNTLMNKAILTAKNKKDEIQKQWEDYKAYVNNLHNKIEELSNSSKSLDNKIKEQNKEYQDLLKEKQTAELMAQPVMTSSHVFDIFLLLVGASLLFLLFKFLLIPSAISTYKDINKGVTGFWLFIEIAIVAILAFVGLIIFFFATLPIRSKIHRRLNRSKYKEKAENINKEVEQKQTHLVALEMEKRKIDLELSELNQSS